MMKKLELLNALKNSKPEAKEESTHMDEEFLGQFKPPTRTLAEVHSEALFEFVNQPPKPIF
jgi:hypothetical protein